jgi:predicted nuclease with TOPRIM domain
VDELEAQLSRLKPLEITVKRLEDEKQRLREEVAHLRAQHTNSNNKRVIHPSDVEDVKRDTREELKKLKAHHRIEDGYELGVDLTRFTQTIFASIAEKIK